MSKMRPGAALVVLAAVLGSPALCLAGPDDALARAKLAFERAQTAYDARDYEAALAGYQEAYRLTEAPALLFNVAQCYRLLGRDKEALGAYRDFLAREPDTPYRAEIEGHVRTLEARIASAPREAVPAASAERPAPAKPPGDEVRPARPRFALAGVAAGALVAWGVFGAGALALDARAKDPGPDGGLDEAGYRRRLAFSAVADLSLATALGAGAAFAFSFARPERRAPALRPGVAPAPSGAIVTLAFGAR